MAKCTARSSQSGEQCRQNAIKGGTVCVAHGGRAPQVRAKADERLAAMVDPALTMLLHLIENADSDSVKLGAVKDALDRAGLKPVDKSKVDVNGDFRVVIGQVADRG